MKWPIPPILLAVTAMAMIAAHRVVAMPANVPAPLNCWIGLPLIVAGLALSAAGSRQFRRAETNIHIFRRPDVLDSDGVFFFSRNPMYLGFALALLGFAIKLGSPLDFAVVAGFVVVVDLWYIRFEERMAAETFGKTSEACRRETRRWI